MNADVGINSQETESRNITVLNISVNFVSEDTKMGSAEVLILTSFHVLVPKIVQVQNICLAI
jgi:hypothetical protein